MRDRRTLIRRHIASPVLCNTDDDVDANINFREHFLRCSAASGILVDRVSCRGYLIKMGRLHKTWLRRWFVLSLATKRLDYFTSEDEKTRKGSVDLKDIFKAVEQYTPDETLPTFHVMTPYRTFHLRSPEPNLVRSWMVIFDAIII